MQSRVTLAPHWVRALMTEAFGNQGQWSDFLQHPAAAPVLRAACRILDEQQAAEAAGILAGVRAARPDAGPGGDQEAPPFAIFDVDTAAALAVLGWRGGDLRLAARALDTVISGCRRDGWDLRDIP